MIIIVSIAVKKLGQKWNPAISPSMCKQ